MDVLDTINRLENDLKALKAAVTENMDRQQETHMRELRFANVMRRIYSGLSAGLSSWQVAESVQPYFSSLWDAYYCVSSYKTQENARKRFARDYMIKALSDAGFGNVAISKIAGCTPQRCGQVLKKRI